MATTFIQGSFKFEVLDEMKKTVKIKRKSEYETLSGKLVIPSSVTNEGINYKVVEIGGRVREYQSAKYEKIPDKRTALGYREGKMISGSLDALNAFEKTEIIELIIPNTITKIDGYAFRYCKKLTKVTLPKGLSVVAYKAFEYCESLKEVTIPSSVERIGGDAFRSCTNLQSVTISQGVKTIGSYAFWGTNIKKITIPSSVDNIESCAFGDTKSLSEAIIDDSDGIISVDSNAFSRNCKVKYKSQMGFFGKLFN